MGEPTYILGIQVQHDKERRTLTISQTRYIDEILKRFNMEDCKSVKTPMDACPKNENAEPEVVESSLNVPFQTLVGSLMYLVQGTRTDTAFATSHLSHFNSSHTQNHWRMAKRILRYLKGTRDVGITYAACQERISGYTDASFNENGTGRSRSAYVYTLSQGAVSWRSTRQQLVALSTCEAEYIALVEALKEGKWFKTFNAKT
ncbi:uncharacterized protein LOC135375604 [Ornithodoros turicata]|uniref:uncharacterized protein LOC135375604 n=1 Tax=Ornithodoros turicata TaxID=34597 RepID=UPI003139416B